MTSFVEILPKEYDKDAFKRFDASASDFKIDNARALMWFSQLAYETHRPSTINAIALGEWEFTSVTPFIQQKTSVTASFETCGLIGQRDKAVILAFAGTDPGIWQKPISRRYRWTAPTSMTVFAWPRKPPSRKSIRPYSFAGSRESRCSSPATALARRSQPSRPRERRTQAWRPARFIHSACRGSEGRYLRQATLT
jgi:hypothetical protein